MNLPNRLTILRIFLSFVCAGLILKETLVSLSFALLVFLIASFTDYLDGLIARKKNLISDLGRIIDPIADKILIILVFLAFLELRVIHSWMVGIIILREFTITGLRLFVLSRGTVLEAKRFGKHKTFSQIIAIILILSILILSKLYPHASVVNFLYRCIDYIMWYVVLVTFFSGVYYLWANRKIIKTF